MRISVTSRTLGDHTHLSIWVNGGQVCDDLTLRNEHAAEFLARLKPEELTDDTPEGHWPVAARWAWGPRVGAKGKGKTWLDQK